MIFCSLNTVCSVLPTKNKNLKNYIQYVYKKKSWIESKEKVFGEIQKLMSSQENIAF